MDGPEMRIHLPPVREGPVTESLYPCEALGRVPRSISLGEALSSWYVTLSRGFQNASCQKNITGTCVVTKMSSVCIELVLRGSEI